MAYMISCSPYAAFVRCSVVMVLDTPSNVSWDDDNPTPLKKSSWDLQTPRSHSGSSSRSERSYSERSSDRRSYRDGDKARRK